MTAHLIAPLILEQGLIKFWPGISVSSLTLLEKDCIPDSPRQGRDCICTVYAAERRDVLGCTMYIPDDQDISRETSQGRSLWDISRAEGNLEVGGDVQPNISRLEAVYGHYLIINPYQGIYQEIHPCNGGSISSLKSRLPWQWWENK